MRSDYALASRTTKFRPEPAFRVNDDNQVILLIDRCDKCAHAMFPARRLGCERCGASPSQLTLAEVPANAEVVASSMVHLAPGSSMQVPSTVALLRLDAIDLMIHGRLADERLSAGTAVVGKLSADNEQQLVFVERV